MGIRAEGKVRRIGNSLGVILPSNMLKKLMIDEGDTVMIMLDEGEIKIINPDQNSVDDEFKQKVLSILDEYFKEQGKK